jgi:hypothetical protein
MVINFLVGTMSRCDLITRVLTIKFGRKKKNIKTIQLSNRASQIFETDLYFFPFSRFIAARFIPIKYATTRWWCKEAFRF